MLGPTTSRALFFLVAVFGFGSPAVAQGTLPAPRSTISDTGILLMAHGGSKDWNEQINNVVRQVDKQMPAEVAFGMADRKTLQQGIDKRTARGVKQIVAVPLFVSSYSSVIESTKYLLGLRSDPPKELADFTMDLDMPGMPNMIGHADADAGSSKPLQQPVKCRVPIRMSAALDQHPIVAEILSERAAAIGRDPSREVLILVAHGPNDDQENERWLANMNALAKQIAALARYVRIECVTLRDDADAAVRDRATAILRKTVQAADDGGYHALVVPLLLSYGGIENGLRKRLDGIEYTFSPQALLPDPRITRWVLESAQPAH